MNAQQQTSLARTAATAEAPRYRRFVGNLLLLALLVIFTACAPGGRHRALKAFGGGSGTENDPYLIATEAHLRNVNTASQLLDGKHLRLTADITLAGPWTPIGKEYNSFGGIFEGGGHTISQLTINDAQCEYAGLFGFVNRYGVIRNLTVETAAEGIAVAHQGASVGAIAGYNMGRIENCAARGLVQAGSVAGGIVGENKGSIKNCTNDATIALKASAGQADKTSGGGIAGIHTTVDAASDDVLLSGCQNKGQVTVEGGAYVRAGGIAAYNSSSARIEDCANEGTVSASADSEVYAGGVVGEIDSGASATGCVNRSAVTATGREKACVGGVAGQMAGAKLVKCRSKNAVTAKGNPARRGIVVGSKQLKNTITDCGSLR